MSGSVTETAAAATERQQRPTIADTLATVPATAKRVLIDWEWGADGIWTILSAEELSAPGPAGRWEHRDELVRGPVDPALVRPRPWSDKLSSDLVEALKK